LGIRAYAIVGFFIISLLFTQYAFAQFAGCGPNEIRNVEGECVSAFDDEPSSSTLSVETDRSSYNDGDTIRISGNAEIIESDVPVPVTIIIVDPAGDITAISQVYPSSDGRFSHTITAGGVMQITGDYEVSAQYGAQKVYTSFSFTTSVSTISISTDKTSYKSGDIISITGKTSMTNIYVTMMVQKPNGNIISVSQISPDYSGAFGDEVVTTTPTLWDLTGTYTVSVQQGENNMAKTTFYFESVFAGTPKLLSSSPRQCWGKCLSRSH